MKTFQDYGIDVPFGSTGNIRTTCPECSKDRKKASEKCLAVNLSEGVWLCHHCGYKGGLKNSHETEHVHRSKVFKVPVFVTSKTLPDNVIQYFKKRGISEGVLSLNAISHGPSFGEKNGIQFPYIKGGKVVNVKHRGYDKSFRMEKDAEKCLYRFDSLQKLVEDGEKTIIIAEGEIDTLSLCECGYHNSTSVPDGAPSTDSKTFATKFDFLESAAEIFEKCDTVILATDNDGPGRVCERELARRIGLERCWRVTYPDGCKDANDVMVKYGKDRLRRVIMEATPYPIEGIISPLDIKPDIMALYDVGFQRGAETGWPALDEYYTIRPCEITVVTGIPGAGKALSIDTMIPTVMGWKTMGGVSVGDTLFDENGGRCTVTRVTEIMYGRKCYKLRFSDGTEIVADEDHQWLTRDERARISQRNTMVKRGNRKTLKLRGHDQTHKRTFPSVKTTKTISETMLVENGNRKNHAIDISCAINCEKSSLVIKPYTLGVWLGDGTSLNAQITNKDKEVIDGVLNDGYGVTKWNRPYSYGVSGIRDGLKDLGVFGNKHIPTEYLRASATQRIELLKGLMDTDGYCKPGGGCEFYSTNRKLAIGVAELVRTLGCMARIREGRAMLNGADCGPKYTVSFNPDFVVFKIKRKAERHSSNQNYGKWKVIVGCDPVESVPVKCIEVDSDSHLYLAGDGFTPTHNSNWLDCLAINLSQLHGWKFGVFSPENWPVERHTQGLLEKLTGKPFAKNGRDIDRMSKEEADYGLSKLNSYFKFIVPKNEILSVDTILEKTKALVFRNGINGLIIDPWNEVEHLFGSLTETQYISQQLSKLRLFARRNGIHIWVVAHPRNLTKDDKGEYKPPTMYEISGGAHWRNKADNGICIHRPDYEIDETEVGIQKIRFREVGKVGMVKLRYCRDTGNYS